MQMPLMGQRHDRSPKGAAIPEDTRDLQRAARRLTEMEDRISGKPRKTIPEAVIAFHAQNENKAPETKRKYKRILQVFSDFCGNAATSYVDQVNVETMDRYTLSRAKDGW